MKLASRTILMLLVLFSFGYLYSQPAQEKTANPYAASTYECSSIYWKTPEASFCKIRYKEVKSNIWKNGLDLVYDSRQGEYRGSLISLAPNTEYLAELSSSSAKTQLTFKTRSDNFRIGKTTLLPSGESDKTILVTESGTQEAYHLVTVPENSKSVLNLKNVSNYGVEINADYVIIRGVEIRNAANHGIIIRKGRHDIVIEQCYITFWGRLGGPRTYGNLDGGMDSGIWAEDGTQNLTIQRNLIEEPRGASNDWETGHPAGPQGISVIQSKGGNVIRYNDILSTEDHGFNDGIGGGDNFSNTGNMNRDSDIHGNIIKSVWDDAIECEGGNMNVRIWGNYLKQYFVGIASASTTYGPLYMFRNIFAESRRGHRNTLGGSMFKTGEREPFAGGRRYIFHNTALQPNGPYSAIGRIQNTITRNNIFDVPGRMPSDTGRGIPCDYDFDFLSGGGSGSTQEQHAARITATPSGTRLFVTSFNLEFYPRSTLNAINWGAHPYEFGERKVNVTDPVVWIKNPMIDGGAVLPGFNDNFKGSAPDIGAFEVGAPPLQFGRRAYLKYDEGWCPWEKY
jgi:hypothetical protein